jgi:hypothetical protein
VVLKRKQIDVLFYYPQHFNRSIEATNPFFEPLLRSCAKNNLSYIVVEEPDGSTDIPSNPNAKRFYVYFFLITAIRKIVPLVLFSDFEAREQFIGKIINFISLGNLRAKNYITLSNSMGGVLRGINPKGKIFDYQHGIITSTQPGFFQNHKVPNWISSNNKDIFVYGKGFKDIMIRTDKNYYHDKVHIIGAPDMTHDNFIKGDHILISLQIVEKEHVKLEFLNAQVEMLEDLFKKYAESSQLSNRIVYLRHHPRSNRSFNLEKLFAFPFVKYFDSSNESFQIGLHVTFFSTSAFDFAAMGIPTLFLFNDIIPQGKELFFEEFKYPYQKWNSIEDWLFALNSSESVLIKNNINNWYSLFYEPYNEEAFIKIINNNE